MVIIVRKKFRTPADLFFFTPATALKQDFFFFLFINGIEYDRDSDDSGCRAGARFENTQPGQI